MIYRVIANNLISIIYADDTNTFFFFKKDDDTFKDNNLEDVKLDFFTCYARNSLSESLVEIYITKKTHLDFTSLDVTFENIIVQYLAENSGYLYKIKLRNDTKGNFISDGVAIVGRIETKFDAKQLLNKRYSDIKKITEKDIDSAALKLISKDLLDIHNITNLDIGNYMNFIPTIEDFSTDIVDLHDLKIDDMRILSDITTNLNTVKIILPSIDLAKLLNIICPFGVYNRAKLFDFRYCYNDIQDKSMAIEMGFSNDSFGIVILNKTMKFLKKKLIERGYILLENIDDIDLFMAKLILLNDREKYVMVV